MKPDVHVSKNLSQMKMMQEVPQDAETHREKPIEDKKYIPRRRDRVPRASRCHRWAIGRTAATLQR